MAEKSINEVVKEFQAAFGIDQVEFRVSSGDRVLQSPGWQDIEPPPRPPAPLPVPRNKNWKVT